MLGARLSVRKLQNMKKTISIAEAKHLSVSGLFTKATETNSISNMEFNVLNNMSRVGFTEVIRTKTVQNISTAVRPSRKLRQSLKSTSILSPT